MTHKVEVLNSNGTPVEGQGYTTTKEHTSGQVRLKINGREIIVDTFDVYRNPKAPEDIATCVTFPDTLASPLGQRVERFNTPPIYMIKISAAGKTVPIEVPDKSHPTAPPIGIYITRL